MWLFRRRAPAALPEAAQAYLGAALPDRRAPWRAARYVVLDCETSGLDARRDAILSVGAVEVVGGRALLERRWYSPVRPPAGLQVPGASIRVHGLLRADLADAPAAEEVLPQLLALLAGAVLVVHVASVDVAFLNAALQARYGVRLRGPTLDTARLAMTLHENARYLGDAGGQAPAIQLGQLCERMGLPVFAEHHALADALTTAQLLLAQASRLERQGYTTLGDLLRAGGA